MDDGAAAAARDGERLTIDERFHQPVDRVEELPSHCVQWDVVRGAGAEHREQDSRRGHDVSS